MSCRSKKYISNFNDFCFLGILGRVGADYSRHISLPTPTQFPALGRSSLEMLGWAMMANVGGRSDRLTHQRKLKCTISLSSYHNKSFTRAFADSGGSFESDEREMDGWSGRKERVFYREERAVSGAGDRGAWAMKRGHGRDRGGGGGGGGGHTGRRRSGRRRFITGFEAWIASHSRRHGKHLHRG